MKMSWIGKLAASALVTVALGANLALAHSPGEVGTATEGHLKDGSNHPVKDGFGHCVNLGYSVGAGHPADCEVQPVKKAEAPKPPPPPPPPPPVKPAPTKISLQAETLFDFDKSIVKPGGKAAIDAELAKLGPSGSIESITVTGHTDSIGTDKYNQKLSERRANAVKAYLVSKGLADTKITTVGKGESQPVASNKTKAGRAQNRRVEVEFQGVAK